MDKEEVVHQILEFVPSIDWDVTAPGQEGVSVFETTIRHLGGLLSAYDLSGEMALLVKAKELGDLLYMAFDTPNRLPPFWLTFKSAKYGSQTAGGHDPSGGGGGWPWSLASLKTWVETGRRMAGAGEN